MGLLVSGLSCKGGRGGYRKEQRDVVPFSSGRPELSELCENGAPGQGHGEREEGEGVPI